MAVKPKRSRKRPAETAQQYALIATVIGCIEHEKVETVQPYGILWMNVRPRSTRWRASSP